MMAWQWKAEVWRGGSEARGRGMAKEGNRLTALVTTKKGEHWQK